MSNKSRGQKRTKGPVRSRGSGRNTQKAEDARKQKLVEELRESLTIARERTARARERKDTAYHDMIMCLNIMNEEFEPLEAERKKKDLRWEDYRTLRDKNNAQINEIKHNIKSLRKKEQQCYERSKKAYYSSKNDGRAAEYAAKGAKYRKDQKDLYDEVHRLGAEVRERRLELESSTSVDDKFFKAARAEYLAAKEAEELAVAEYEEARAEEIRIEEELIILLD